jgi:hypothetical protein
MTISFRSNKSRRNTISHVALFTSLVKINVSHHTITNSQITNSQQVEGLTILFKSL